MTLIYHTAGTISNSPGSFQLGKQWLGTNLRQLSSLNGMQYGYNALGQITQVGGAIYNYSPTQNNGQIQSMQTGNAALPSGIETTTYQYDALNRLISATATNTVQTTQNYSENYAYDGWGNRTQQHTVRNGGAYNNDYAFDPATNRLAGPYLGHSFDANGNDNFQGAGYDSDNRVTQIGGSQLNSPTEQYMYAPDHKRVYKMIYGVTNTEEYYFLDTNGQKLAVVSWSSSSYYQISKMSAYLGRKLVYNQGQRLYTDRLGSAVGWGSGESASYYPYGEDRTAAGQDRVKFATYHRDGTGIDYADQRYYASGVGRFLTADPYLASGGAGEPGSWNRYAYAGNDPVNKFDPRGLVTVIPPYDPDNPLSAPECGEYPLANWCDYEPPIPNPDPLPVVGSFNYAENAKDRASKRLDTNKCFELIFKNSKWKTVDRAKGELKLRDIQLADLGPVTIGGTPDKWGIIRATWGGNDGGTIYLNSNVFPNSTLPTVIGVGGPKSPLEVFNHQYGVNLTADQFEEIIILHELWHIAGGTPDSEIDSEENRKALITTCIPN